MQFHDGVEQSDGLDILTEAKSIFADINNEAAGGLNEDRGITSLQYFHAVEEIQGY